jgi:hypothetical protein
MVQLEGASTARMGREVVSRREIMDGKGSRRGGWKEKPNMASMMTSLVVRAEAKEVVKGMWRVWSWVVRRWVGC